MSLSTPIKSLALGSKILYLYLDGQTPLVECEGLFFSHIWVLVQQLPLLSNLSYLKEFAEISNYLWKGLEFQFIESIANYQISYRTQVEFELKNPSDVFPYRLTDFKIFDVSVMQEPYLEEGNLIYYVFQGATGIPYRVVCPFPYTSTSTLVHYQILPILDI